MEYTKILFYIFSFIAIFASLLTIFIKNTIKATLFLVLAFFSFASLWLLIKAEFLAIILILVYVGALMVLFLFVIKMLNVDANTLQAKFTAYLPLGIIIAILIIAEIFLVLNGNFIFYEPYTSDNYSNISALAFKLYTTYVFQFELAAVILLVAIIAAIGLVFQKTKNRKVQNISQQIDTQAKDRLRVIKGAGK